MHATVCQQPSDDDNEARSNFTPQIPKAREFPQGRRERREEKHVRAGDGGAHPGRGGGGVGCRRVRGGELDAGDERDLGGTRGEPARVEHPLPHGHGHLHDHVRRGEWIPNPGGPELPSRVVLELSKVQGSEHLSAARRTAEPGRVPPARRRFCFFFSFSTHTGWNYGRLRGLGNRWAPRHHGGGGFVAAWAWRGPAVVTTPLRDGIGGARDRVRVSPAGMPEWIVRKGQDN